MRYWTMYEVGIVSKNRSYSRELNGVAGLYRLGGTPAKECGSPKAALASAAAIALVLVEPTPEDILALGNALVAPGSPGANTKIVIPPGNVAKLGTIRSHAQTYRDWGNCSPEYDASEFSVIRDGKVVDFLCGDCDKILGRAGDGCEPPMLKCKNPLFADGAELTLPPEELFMAVKRCTDRPPFESYTYKHIKVKVKPSDPIEADPEASADSYKGWTSRYMKTISCKACVFFEGSCMAGIRSPGVRYSGCQGPYIERDLITPSMSQRRDLRYLHFDIPLEAAIDEFGGEKPRIRADPELKITGVSNGMFSVEVTKINSKARGHIRWEIGVHQMQDFLDKRGIIRPPFPPEESSFLEDLITAAYYKGALNSEPAGNSWGGYCGPLASLEVNCFTTKTDGAFRDVTIYYAKSNYLTHYTFSSLRHVMGCYGHQVMRYVFPHVKRGPDIYNTLKSRDKNPGAVPAIEEYVKRLKAADNSDTYFNHEKVLGDVMQKYSVVL